MATLDWPAGRHFSPVEMAWAVLTQKTAFSAPYTGQTQSISLLSDRLRVSLVLPPCFGAEAAEREAFIHALASSADWVRLGHFQRPLPLGTLRGTPTAGAAAIAGAKTLTVQTSAGATLKAGDLLGAPSQLLQCAYPGATANGSGVLAMPLVLPLRKPISSGAALAWNKPVGTFQLLTVQPGMTYRAPRMQAGVELMFSEVYT